MSPEKQQAIMAMEGDGDFQSYLRSFAKGRGQHWLSSMEEDARVEMLLALHNAFLSGAITGMQRALGKEQK